MIACGKDDLNDIIEELADVFNLINQIQLYYGIDDDEINYYIKEKIERTLKRIETGYYDKHR